MINVNDTARGNIGLINESFVQLVTDLLIGEKSLALTTSCGVLSYYLAGVTGCTLEWG
jgi:hypothetical protein